MTKNKTINNGGGIYLSKSLFIRGLQCHKSLYLQKYRPELKDELTKEKENLFSTGHEVGKLAQNLFPGGIEVPYEGLSHSEQLMMTQSLIKEGHDTIYEAAFCHDGIFVKADVLNKGNDGWNLYEVKASTSMKDYHVNDVSVQYHVLNGSGLPLSGAFLVHINNAYVRNGAVEVDKLFAKVDLTEIVKHRQPFILEEIAKERTMLREQEPVIDIGPQCDDPYECDFKGYCWPNISEDSIFRLKGRFDAKFLLYKRGILSMHDVPEEHLSINQRLQADSNRNQHVHYDRDAVNAFVQSLWYPMYFLDFETFSQTIPPFDGTRPYEQIPFQYSLHFIDKEAGALQHHEYLAMLNVDPREELVRKLLGEIPADACVIVYNKSFEIMILRSLASWFPAYSGQIETIISNIRDLMNPFQKKDIYHWKQNGSWSLKSVLPTLVPELSYDGLDIREGGMAGEAYRAMNRSTDQDEIEAIRRSLLEYCHLDTLAMVKILENLQ
jgi:hypothetical protein